MQKQFLSIMLILCSTLFSVAQNNLQLHYTFDPTQKGNFIIDETGNGYNATLENEAFVDKMGSIGVLNLGTANGYLDLGKKTGELISSLTDFTVAGYYCIDGLSNLNSNGNFLWTFANSNDILKDQNGCIFFSAKTGGYSISKTDYRREQGINAGKPLAKDSWQHIVYVQANDSASIYINGIKVSNGLVKVKPTDLGETTHNYLGRSPYMNDVMLKGMFTDFRIYNKALSPEAIKQLSGQLDQLNEAYVAYAQQPKTYKAKQNPVFTHKHTADPAAYVYDDVFYVYAGQDMGDGAYYNMPNWTVFSTTDFETWKEYPIPLKTSDFSWATGNTSWASQVIERNGKFYWYVSTEHATKPGKAVGVAVSDNPTGPFHDARGTAIVSNDMTTQWTGISWDDIDPSVWIDDDGQAYLFWGNTQCYYAKLKENMIELDSDIMPIDLPNFTEAPWIHKHNDWYYLSYAYGWPEKTAYARSKSIEGPWEYQGILNELSGNSNTNHQAIVEYKGKWYFVYHNGGLSDGGSYLRSVCIDYLYHNEDGTIKRIQMTSEGVDKLTD